MITENEEETFATMEKEESEITEYEVERLERIKRNRDMLANLHVEEVATALEPVPKKPRGQSNKGKEKVDYVFSRRTTRLSTRTKAPTKILDWSSGESDSEAPSESDADGDVFSKGPAKKKIKKKKASLSDELFEDEVLMKKQVDEEYEPSDASESDQDEEEADEPGEDRHLQLSEKKQKGRNGRSSGKKAESGKYSFRLQPLSRPTKSAKEEDTEDPDLEQAIQLSMKLDEAREDLSLKSPGAKGAGSSKPRKRKAGRDLKFTQSEVDAYFVTIAGSDIGAISLKLLENAALAHDFIWSEEELQDMIDVFDENDDGFLSLPEFRAMAARCKLMEAS